MELLAGEPLSKLLAARRLPLARALELAHGVASGVAALHRAGLVHRDLKPENIIVVGEARPVIVDLGLALAPDKDERLTKTGGAVGTLGYMAPEQLRGEREAQGPATDVYALGLLLHELVTGQPATPADSSAAEAMRLILEVDRPLPGDLDADLPAALDALVVRATRRDPARRHPDADALLAELDALRAAPGPSRRARRRRLALLGGAAAAIVIAAGAALVSSTSASASASASTSPSTSTATSGDAPVSASPMPKPRPTLDAPTRRAATEELRVARALPAEQRLLCLEAWVQRYPGHPAVDEALALWREDRRRVALERLAETPGHVAFVDDRRALVLAYDGQATFWSFAPAPAREPGGWKLDAGVTAVEVDDAGRRGLVVTPEQRALLVTLADGAARPIGECEGETPKVALSRDGRRAVVGTKAGHEGVVTFFDLEAGRRLHAARLPTPVSAVTFGDDGVAFVACGGDLNDVVSVPVLKLFRWDATSGAVLTETIVDATCCALASRGGALAVGMETRRAELRDAQTLERIRPLVGDNADSLAGFSAAPMAHGGAVRVIRFVGAGRLVSVSGNSGIIDGNDLRIWDQATGRQLARVSTPGYPFQLAVSADGRYALTAEWSGVAEGGVRAWDLDPEPPR
jgi:hypothetical protein